MPNSRADETVRHAEPGVATPESDEQQEGTEAPEQQMERERLGSELSAMEDRYKRALADLDNYRKRTASEVERRTLEQREAMLRTWLEAVDSVERALRMGSPVDPMFEGLRAVLDQMESILARNGVTRVGTSGETFDPERHEAVAVVADDEKPDRSVVEVTRSGFMLGDRVLRPAQVVVSRRQQGNN